MLAESAEIGVTDLCAGAAGGVKLVHMHRVSSHRSFYCVRRLSVSLALIVMPLAYTHTGGTFHLSRSIAHP